MNVRDALLIALVKEVLGPREGPREILPEEEDPRQEYITGVLEPRNARSQDERVEDNVDEVIEETSSEEDQQAQGYVAATGILSPALDPRALPRSIGISFTLEAGSDDPTIKICATWARYRPDSNHDWQREPACYLTSVVNASQDDQSFYPEPDIRLLVRSRPVSGGYRVSVFLVNERQIADDQRPCTWDYLFQPQIRVHLCSHTRLVPVMAGGEDMPGGALEAEIAEEQSLAMQYRKRTALARGHMCAAIWREIDPERPLEGTEHPLEAPYAWTDADSVPEVERGQFSPADVRTELIPVYLVQSPRMGWDPRYGAQPLLDPAGLSETWQPEQLRGALTPLVEGYRAWITEQEEEIPNLEARFQPTAAHNLEFCRQAASRMAEAIDVLCADEQARLAFCFANKAIDMQARWKNPDRPLIWHPFQMAFILLNIPPLVNPLHPDRAVCDLLWFPTGGGKTEAYLGLTAFLLALRRLKARQNQTEDTTGAGVTVISRYTLRLLTIQQFRRALGVITACEVLRVWGLKEGQSAGWRPAGYPNRDKFLWGAVRFSAGLWVGGNVTPNQMRGFGPVPDENRRFTYYAGALDLLRGLKKGYDGPDDSLRKKAAYDIQGGGEPAQVTQCPACGNLLAVPEEGLNEGEHTLHLVYRGLPRTAPPLSLLPKPRPGVQVADLKIRHAAGANDFATLTLQVRVDAQKYWTADDIDRYLWHELPFVKAAQLQPARPSRPGYFILSYPTQKNNRADADFEIFCANPECMLNQHAWAEQVPEPREKTGSHKQNVRQAMLFGPSQEFTPGLPQLANSNWQTVPEPFQEGSYKDRSFAVPIPAFTVDDQVYARCPALVVATVDKFARLAFEGEAATLFGNVTHYHARFGYYREGCPPDYPQTATGNASEGFFRHPSQDSLRREIPSFAPPDLILQDELHLIEGPLGSMVGIYETAVDYLCQRQVSGQTVRPKYIASTATARRAEPQVQALFDRTLAQFPPPALSADERFFATSEETHPLDSSRSGRLYVGICAPGKGAQTPIVRIWSALLQRAETLKGQVPEEGLDAFWTLVGYFNAIRELAGAASLYRQDIPEWLKHRSPAPRVLDHFRQTELSSRSKSTELPTLLKKLEAQFPSPGAQDAAFSTSMFGTGVDVSRLSLMVVHGQPKTTASYIQATGRVGRDVCGLVVTFFRATRPRDLDHYEFFTGYHRALYRYVEPVTVAPFSPRARERCLGPLSVIMLRLARDINGKPLSDRLRVQQRFDGKFYAGAFVMSSDRHQPAVQEIPIILEARSQAQPYGRVPARGLTAQEAASELDRWRAIAALHQNPNDLVYCEPAVMRAPRRNVILGDSQHHLRFDEAFESAPQSLRDVEETTTFQDKF